MKDRHQEALDCVVAIHAPIAGILIRLARSRHIEAGDMLQIRYFRILAGKLAEACHVDVTPTNLPPIPTLSRSIRCLQSLQHKTADLLASCAQFPVDQAFDKPLTIPSIIGLIHELCSSLGIHK